MSTKVSGTLYHCGPGQRNGIEFICEGPNCYTLDGFDSSSCQKDGQTLKCNNGVTCNGDTQFKTEFSYDQDADSTLVREDSQTYLNGVAILSINSDGTANGTTVGGEQGGSGEGNGDDIDPGLRMSG